MYLYIYTSIYIYIEQKLNVYIFVKFYREVMNSSKKFARRIIFLQQFYFLIMPSNLIDIEGSVGIKNFSCQVIKGDKIGAIKHRYFGVIYLVLYVSLIYNETGRRKVFLYKKKIIYIKNYKFIH